MIRASHTAFLPSHARPLAVALLLALLAASLLAVPTVRAAGGDGLRDAANDHRADAGLSPVLGTALLDDISTARAADMAAKRDLEHDMAYVRNRLNAAGVCWTGFGEIIAMTGRETYSYTNTLSQWMNSTPHREILLNGNFNGAGGAYDRASNGAWYSVMVFVTLCGNSVPAGGYGSTPFTDIAGSAFRHDIEWLYDNDITGGCAVDAYCPNAGVTRGQMASFLQRALKLPPTATDYYSDDNGNSHEDAINRLAAAGITSGCAPGRFCPDRIVSREQMASFVVRARGLVSGAGLNLFDDDNRSQHELDIDRLAYEGVTGGCATRRYCPASTVTRGQMAAFLHRAFGD